jgi:predicted nucleic acid-binding protein
VTRLVLLDAGPLGLVTNPRRSERSLACARWLQGLLAAGVDIFVPEIADYEVRRELLRADKSQGLARLDALIAATNYLPLTTAAMREAARFWAEACRQGRPTAPDLALDADVILAAQAIVLHESDAIIATTNVGHLARFAPAALWYAITPNID